MSDYRRIHITIEGPVEGPYQITKNRIENKNGELTTVAKTEEVINFELKY